MAAIPPQLIGQSPAWLATLDQISGSAALDRSMLVVGERGTGKELVAARLHFLSPRWEQAYIVVNCAALSDELLDSELFGHEAGAFTGASKRRLGRFERADKGTLFLDEIATASPRVQEKLLRIIEYGEFERLGGEKTITVDVRVIGATNIDLPQAVKDGDFRADLLDRLAFDVITLPPLRVRGADIMPLADHFGKRMAVELGADSFPGFTPNVLEFLSTYEWPGNVRELKNVTERAIGRAFNEYGGLYDPIAKINLDPFEAPWRLTSTPKHTDIATQDNETSKVILPEGTNFTDRTNAFELGLIKDALARSKNHQGKAADILGLSYHQFRGLLRKHGLRK
ncbi:MAG: phage shock protein operon transcriptional activator [Robiginitomaculum sp.]|nr:MAG: phage shock protein operon transcriptional activator [Robiginitomaculum sp.]